MESIKETIESLQMTVDLLTNNKKGCSDDSSGLQAPAGEYVQHEDATPGAPDQRSSPKRSADEPSKTQDGNASETTRCSHPTENQALSNWTETSLPQMSKIQQPLSDSIVGRKSEQSMPGVLSVRCHPLLSISHQEMMRLIQIYKDECGPLYPLVDIEVTRAVAARFCADAAKLSRPESWRVIEIDEAFQESLQRLMVILSIAAAIEGPQCFAFASALIDEVEAGIDHRPCGVSCNMHLIELLTLMVRNPVMSLNYTPLMLLHRASTSSIVTKRYSRGEPLDLPQG